MPILLGLAFATAGLDAVSPSSAAVLAWVNGWVAAYISSCAHVIGSRSKKAERIIFSALFSVS